MSEFLKCQNAWKCDSMKKIAGEWGGMAGIKHASCDKSILKNNGSTHIGLTPEEDPFTDWKKVYTAWADGSKTTCDYDPNAKKTEEEIPESKKGVEVSEPIPVFVGVK